MERKSVYSQLQGQVSSMEEAIKDKDGTIETLQRQLVQAGIKLQVDKAGNEIRKDVLQTEAEQKLLRGILKTEFESMKKDMKREFEDSRQQSKNDLEKK